MRKINNFATSLVLIFSMTSICLASSDMSHQKPDHKMGTAEEFQKIIDKYKDYLSTVKLSVREEIVKYRIAISQINKEKKMLYRKLSQESQNYLKEEQKFKKQLPIGKKSLVNIQNPGEQKKKDKNSK